MMYPITPLHVILVGLFTAIVGTLAEERCQFPRSWKGKWYQSGLGEVVIREKLITEKGSCFEHQRDYYLVRNRDRDCYQCLLLMERHKNIIQYKQSYCVPMDSLRNICAHIRVETPLYTLVRDPAIPTNCPFKDAFYFDYNDQASGFCDQKISYAKPCAGHTKYQLHFKHCKPYVMFHNSDLDLGCVASWKDGSDTYMYAKFSGPAIATKDNSYRCFKYRHYGTEMYMAMSADATCQGLISPRDGPITMEFSKDIFGWPPPSCNYPDWLADVTWRDIDGRHTFSFVTDSRVMTGSYRKRVTTVAGVQSEHRCVQVMEDSSSDGQSTAIIYSFTTHKCMSKHQCLKFIKNKEGKVQFYQGAMGDYESGKVCLTDGEYGEQQILMEENPVAVECPLRGIYLMQDGEGCHQRITIGCTNRTLLSFSATCDNLPEESAPPAVSLQCLLTWEDQGRVYLLAKEPGVDTRLVNCFSFKERQNTVHYTTDRKCGVTSGGLDKSVRYELLQRESCEDTTDSMVLPAPPGSDPDGVTPPRNSGTNFRPQHSPSGDRGLTDDADYSDLDFQYAEPDDVENSNPAPYPPSHVTPVPRGRDRDDRRRGRHRPRDRSRDRQRDGTRIDDEDDFDEEDLALSDADLLPETHDTNRDTNYDMIDKPYPKYSQVDQSKFALPTEGANRRQHTSSADTLHTYSHVLLVLLTVYLAS